MNYIMLHMSLCGSAAFVLYGVFMAIWKNSATAAFRYRLLKLVMCFYLLPVPHYSIFIREFIHALVPSYPISSIPEGVWVPDFENKIYVTPEGIRFSGNLDWILLLTVSFFLVTLGLVFFYSKNFRKMRGVEACLAEAPQSLKLKVEQLRKELGIRRKISVFCYSQPSSPFCYGFLKPRIVISDQYSPEEYEILLRHELWHIKSLDFVTRSLCFFIVALHFFNPLVYLLFYEMDKVSELACDARVLSGCTKEERIQYGHLLLDVIPSIISGYSNSFNGSSLRVMQERIAMIKRSRKIKPLAFVFCAMVMMCCGALPATGYQPLQVEWHDDVPSKNVTHMIVFGEDASIFEDPNESYLKNSDHIFVEDDGTVYIDLENSKDDVRVSCKHSYHSGNLYDHELTNDGGCTYKKYSADLCSKCNNVINIKYINTLTYAICPHK